MIRPGHRQALAWLGLAAASALAVALLKAAALPAALVLGPMLVAIAAALLGLGLQLPAGTMTVVQALFGCLIAAAVNPALLAALREHGLLLAAASAASIVLSAAIGALISRRGWLPGATAVWGLSPGGASTMVVLSEAHGADPRSVAVMQYLRIFVVALTVVALAAAIGVPGHADRASAEYAGTDSRHGLLLAALLVAAAALLAHRLGLRSLGLLLPAVIGGALQGTGLARIIVPDSVAAIAFGLVGWAVGLCFTRASLAACWRQMPAILAGIAILVAGCGALSWAFLRLSPGIDPLTAWLAMAPGGLDTAVAIATTVQVSLPVVIAAQLVRLCMVTVTAPAIARQVSRWQRIPTGSS
jgi:uncharacterized protein